MPGCAILPHHSFTLGAFGNVSVFAIVRALRFLDTFTKMYMVGTYYSSYNFHFLVFAQDSDNVPYEKVVNWLKCFCSSD